jgi:hypothetical protein
MAQTVPFDIDLNLTTHRGDSTRVQITISYPEGHGLYAIDALEELGTNTEALYREMADRKNASTIQGLTAMAYRTANQDNPVSTTVAFSFGCVGGLIGFWSGIQSELLLAHVTTALPIGATTAVNLLRLCSGPLR